MAKYRKKPVVIEAFQMTKEARHDNSNWPNWLHNAWNTHSTINGALFCDGKEDLAIRTLEGVLNVSWGDFIIQGVQGELYPCKPDIFEDTYEQVE